MNTPARRRLRGRAAVVALTVLSLGACTDGHRATGGADGAGAARTTSSPSAAHAPAPSGSPTPTAHASSAGPRPAQSSSAASPAPPRGTTAPTATADATGRAPAPARPSQHAFSYRGIRLALPTTWTAEGGAAPDPVCLGPATTQPGACHGIQLYVGATSSDPHGGRFGDSFLAPLDLDLDDGWAIGQPGCRAPGASSLDADTPPTAARITRRDPTTLADGRRAIHRQWRVTCASGRSFTVEAWYLPHSKVLAYARAVPPAERDLYARVVGSMDLRDQHR
ncbi:hypothetical protein AB0J57_02005 [Streptomyces sp. NPDC049837]|uniref:hypothetical protein n=1 Tax=Streptomyces sp. NPDC049837 TaxID=3155277 RepID=UPI00341712A8